jgi:hypothetical protein
MLSSPSSLTGNQRRSLALHSPHHGCHHTTTATKRPRCEPSCQSTHAHLWTTLTLETTDIHLFPNSFSIHPLNLISCGVDMPTPTPNPFNVPLNHRIASQDGLLNSQVGLTLSINSHPLCKVPARLTYFLLSLSPKKPSAPPYLMPYHQVLRVGLLNGIP